MRFVVIAHDKPNSLELRKSTRDAHLAYMSEFDTLVGGPMLDTNDDMCGSVVIFEAESKAEVEAIAANDPYMLAGLFESVVIRGFKTVMWPQ